MQLVFSIEPPFPENINLIFYFLVLKQTKVSNLSSIDVFQNNLRVYEGNLAWISLAGSNHDINFIILNV